MVLATMVALLWPGIAAAGSAPLAPAIGKVTFIQRGLKVRPAHGPLEAGKVLMPLFPAYGLQTGAGERASIGFHDGTTVHLGQLTDVVLRSASLTTVNNGQVNEILAPGTNHRVQTSAAVAAAIGTNFLVRIVGGGSYFMVLRGAVLVKNAHGSELVKARQGTFVVPGQAPEPAYPVDTVHSTVWADTMPTPNLGENVALDGSGGRVMASSSQRPASGGVTFSPANVIDGNLATDWESAQGQVTNQWVKIALAGTHPHHLYEVLIDPAAAGAYNSSADLKDFEIRVSTTGTSDSDFHTVMRGSCQATNHLQRFKLPAYVASRYVELYAVSNHGSAQHVAVTEFEAVAKD
jgi:hypothetical protein